MSKKNVIEQMIGLLRTPIAQRKGINIPSDECLIWASELEKELKSLPERFNLQPKQEWSEEDENNINSIVSRLEVDISYWESRSKTRTNEDEKLINWLKSLISNSNEVQKSADKVEPKFHKGDWIVFNGLTLNIKEVVKGYYRTTSIDGITNSYDWDIDSVARLWAIQDAKDGDVLAAHECIVLFKEIDGLNIKCHCTYHFMNNPSFYVNTLQNKSAFHPATKEQRELLFQKMREAGYTFDFEKKELKKIVLI